MSKKSANINKRKSGVNTLSDIDARAASKSLGHDINTHFRIYNSTYDQVDAIKASKRLNS